MLYFLLLSKNSRTCFQCSCEENSKLPSRLYKSLRFCISITPHCIKTEMKDNHDLRLLEKTYSDIECCDSAKPVISITVPFLLLQSRNL
jgi:hypothetical protein